MTDILMGFLRIGKKSQIILPAIEEVENGDDEVAEEDENGDEVSGPSSTIIASIMTGFSSGTLGAIFVSVVDVAVVTTFDSRRLFSKC